MDEANRTLKRVITDFKDYIETTTKGPIVERSKVNDFGGVIVKEEQKVSSATCILIGGLLHTYMYMYMCIVVLISMLYSVFHIHGQGNSMTVFVVVTCR